MSSLISISIKTKEGRYEKFMVSISDTTDQYGTNVSMYKEQTKEERDMKKPREYIGNGKVIWTDGKIVLAEKKKAPEPSSVKMSDDEDGDLPF